MCVREKNPEWWTRNLPFHGQTTQNVKIEWKKNDRREMTKRKMSVEGLKCKNKKIPKE